MKKLFKLERIIDFRLLRIPCSYLEAQGHLSKRQFDQRHDARNELLSLDTTWLQKSQFKNDWVDVTCTVA